jgi:hypothetical protein
MVRRFGLLSFNKMNIYGGFKNVFLKSPLYALAAFKDDRPERISEMIFQPLGYFLHAQRVGMAAQILVKENAVGL